MFDGFWSGIFGGLFGPAIAEWLGKFKYWVVFLAAMLGTHIGLFMAGAYERGLSFAIQATLKETFTPVGIFVPAGIGLLAVLVAFVGSLSAPKKEKQSDHNANK